MNNTKDFIHLIDALERSAKALTQQNKSQAEAEIKGMKEDIKAADAIIAQMKAQAQTDFENTQKVLAHTTSEKNEAFAEREDLQGELRSNSTKMAATQTDINQHNNRIHALSSEIKKLEEKMERVKKYYTKPTDVGGWFSSTWETVKNPKEATETFLDEGLTTNLSAKRNEKRRYEQERNRYDAQLSKLRQTEKNLNSRKAELDKEIQDLTQEITALEKAERKQGARVAYLLDLNLFIGKLAITLDDVEDETQDILDIVEELNDKEPRITDFDPDNEDQLSLLDALKKLRKQLGN